MHEDMTTTLERAKPFDRAFIDAMVPHHRGAIRMARVALGKAEDRELRRLARSIITTQSDEIVDMNAWRKRWYGAATPKKAGGGHEMDRGEGSGSKMENEGETH